MNSRHLTSMRLAGYSVAGYTVAGYAIAVGLLMLAGLMACRATGSGSGSTLRPLVELPAPNRPAACRALDSGAALQTAIDSAPPGTALCLAPGTYAGPVRLDRNVTVWGPREAVIRSNGEGTTVRITATGAALLGLTIDGTGGRYDLQDAAVLLQADDARVEGVYIDHAMFGILVEKANRCLVRGNEVNGLDEGSFGLRGDGIRLWETRDSRVEGNRIRHSRDMVLWYSSRNRVADNTIEDSRYGTHLMFSHDNVLERNRFIRNVVGVFVMYSRNVELRGNLIANSSGTAGVGLGIKESGNLTVTDNLFLNNTSGMHLDTTPLQVDDFNRFERNVFRLSDVGIFFLSSQQRNMFRDNSFRDNLAQVRVGGGGDALGVTWEGNDFDDYAGYDLDSDGRGDLPYQLRSLSGELIGRYPNTEFFHGMPALHLIDAVSHIVPLFEPKMILIDKSPRMAALSMENHRAD